jgi:hypothetical protein
VRHGGLPQQPGSWLGHPVAGAVRHLGSGWSSVLASPARGGTPTGCSMTCGWSPFGRADNRFARLAATLTAGMNAVGPGSPASRRLVDAWTFFLFLRGEFPRLTALWKEQRLSEWLCVMAIRWPIAHSR